MPLLRPSIRCLRAVEKIQQRSYSSPSSPATSPFAPRHLLSIADLSSTEFTTLIRNAHSHKQAMKSGSVPKSLLGALAGKTVALTFNKRSTRTRISTEGAVAALGGHPVRPPRLFAPDPYTAKYALTTILPSELTCSRCSSGKRTYS